MHFGKQKTDQLNHQQESALKGLVDPETWKLLQKADDKRLQACSYIVKCETCKQVYLETSLLGAKEMYLKAQPDPDLPRNLIPFLWYIEAARHFIHNTYHSVRCLAIIDGQQHVVKDLSSEWKAGFPANLKKFGSQEAMIKGFELELDTEERYSHKAYGKTQ